MKTENTFISQLVDITLISITKKDREISNVCCDSRKSDNHSVFVCISGAQADGHQYAQNAYENGTRFFVVEHPIELPSDADIILSCDTRKTLAQCAAILYDHPENEIDIIAITGTKGKTTTALMVYQLLNQAGIKTGYIGTNGISYGEHHLPTINSTPDSITIYHTLRQMIQEQCKVVAIEASSQGLWQNRLAGLHFKATVFTNISPDHIGGNEHPDFEHYKNCKKLLFSDYLSEFVFYNAADPLSSEIVSQASGKKISFSILSSAASDWHAGKINRIWNDNYFGISFEIDTIASYAGHSFKLPLPGDFNVSNALCAIAIACDVYSIPLQNLISSVANLSIEGRFEQYTHPNKPGTTFVIDYAHNGISMSSIIRELREYHPNRIICLFGSVGERTFERRKDLAIAASVADYCILTSDNPGNENPMDIIEQINSYFPSSACPRSLIIDRLKAVQYAVEISQKGDIVLLAGKGHEQYQLIGNKKEPYSDYDALSHSFDRYK